MQGKVLVLDGVPTNRIVLKVKLATAFYDVDVADTSTGFKAKVLASRPDLIIMPDDMPEGPNGIELCKSLKSDPETARFPIVIITSENNSAKRIAALKAGADDVLSKPVDNALLLARLRSLLRAAVSEDEMRLRDTTSRALGFAEPTNGFARRGKVTILTGTKEAARQCAEQLAKHSNAETEHFPFAGFLAKLAEYNTPDVFVLMLDPAHLSDGLRLLADIRSGNDTRHCGIIAVLASADGTTAAGLLDYGATDLMPDGFDAAELAVRIECQITRKRTAETLRDTVRQGLRAAVIDPLTGLHNRRYALTHLKRVAERSQQTQRRFAVVLADMDYFKQINDTYGHAAGDAVLVEVADRLKSNLRPIDLVARLGGEEFLIVMPDTTLEEARLAADRLCQIVRAAPVKDPSSGQLIGITASFGLALGRQTSIPMQLSGQCDHMIDTLLHQADQALYEAKGKGRNRVRLSRPAA
jgi:two-component system cell cycle response regulator